MDFIPYDRQYRGLRLEAQDLHGLSAKAEAAMPFLNDGHSIYIVQRYTRSVSLNTAGTNRKYFAALLSLPIDGREGTVVSYIIIHVINFIKASLVILMKLRGLPMTSGTIEDILSPEELETFMTIVFQKFESIFYIEENLIDSAENVVYMIILLNIRSICNKTNGLVDPTYISSWRNTADVLKNKEGFESRYYSFSTANEGFRITFNPKKYHNEYLVIYREKGDDLRSILRSREKFSQYEQSGKFILGHISKYYELTEKIFQCFSRPEQSGEDMSLYSPVRPERYLDKLEKPHSRDSDGQIEVPPEKQFRKSHSDDLKIFLNERGIDTQINLPSLQPEDDYEFPEQDYRATESDLENNIDVPAASYIDETADALVEALYESEVADVTEDREPPTEIVDSSPNDVDLDIESDMVTFENAAFVFLEAMKRKLKKKMDNFEYLTLELFHLFIKYGISSLTQANADDHANTIMGENPLEASAVINEFTPARFMKTAREIGNSLHSATDLSDDEEEDHEMNETIVAPEYDFEKTKGAIHGGNASKMIIEKSRFIEKFANNMIKVLLNLGLVQVFAVCTNLCTVDSDMTDFTKEDEPTKWICPFCQTLNEKLQPGSFSSRSQQLVFMISPRLHIACLFEDPSTSNVVLQNSSKYHCQRTDEDTSHTFYNGEYVKRIKQFNKRTKLSNEQEPLISNTKYFDESEIQLAVTLGWDGVAMFSKSVAQLKEPRELWPLVMRLVDFNSNTDFQLINFPSIRRESINVDFVGDETSEEDNVNVTPSMLNTEMTNTKILLSCVTDEFVRIQRKGMLVKNHISKYGDSPVLTVFATVVNFFGDLPALTKFVALRGTAGNAPCLSCNELKEKVEDPRGLYSDATPITIEYNRWLSLEEDSSSMSWAKKVGNEFEHLKGYVEEFDNEGPIRKKARIPFSMTASLTGDNSRFRQKDAEFRGMLKSLCQWVKIPEQYCNPNKHGTSNCCNDSTHMRPLEKRLEELLGVASLDIGSCTPVYDFDLSMGQNKIIGFDVMHCLCENLFPKMLGLLSDSKDKFLRRMRYALRAHILKELMIALQGSLGASGIWPSEFGEPPTLVDTFDTYLKAEQAQQLISLVPALLSSDYYSRELDPDFLRFFQLFAKMSKFLLGHNIMRSEIPILDSTIKEFCSLHRFLFYERCEIKSTIQAWLLQAQNDRREGLPDISTTSEPSLKEIPEVKLMVRMGSNYFHILIHVMTMIKEYGHSNFFSCYGLERSMGTIKSTNNSTNKIITSTGRNMISRSISNCLSVAVAEINCLQTSLLSRSSTDVKRNIPGRNILTLAKPIAHFDVTREAFGRPSFNIEVMENSKTVGQLQKLTIPELSEGHLMMMNFVSGLALGVGQLEEGANKTEQEYLSKMTGLILEQITQFNTPKSLEIANRVMHSTKLYDRLLDETERQADVASADEAGSLSLYVITDYKMHPSRNPTTMLEIFQKWKAITDDPDVNKSLVKGFYHLLAQATTDSGMGFHPSQCSVTESSKCETNVFTLEMPFLIGPAANKEAMDTKKFVLAHINEDIIAYLKKRFPRQFVKSCSSPSESIVPATLSELEKIMRDQNIEKAHCVWGPNLPNPGKTLNISLCHLLSYKSKYSSVFKKSVCVIRSFDGDGEKPRYKLAIILQLFDMKWCKKPVSRTTVFKTIRRRHITSALAFVSDLNIESIHVMPSSLGAFDNGNISTEEETDRESRSAIGLKISAKAMMALCPLLLDHFDEDDPRSSWLSDSADSDDHAFDPSQSSALISLSNVIVGKAGLLFHGESKPTNPKSGFIQIQMSNFNQFEFLAHNEL